MPPLSVASNSPSKTLESAPLIHLSPEQHRSAEAEDPHSQHHRTMVSTSPERSPRSVRESCRLTTRMMCVFVQWAKTEIFFFTVLFASGIILGLLLPRDAKLNGSYAVVSNVLGYTYFIAWSISFYPQILQNYRRGTTHGLSLDFQLLNLLGFLCYTAFAFSFYSVDSVQKAYELRHDGNQNKVSVQDLLFAVHAVIITCITICQIFYYDRRGQRLSWPVTILLISFVLAITVYGVLVATIGGGEDGSFQVIDYLYFISYIKLAISTIKGFPQAYLNYSLKSTRGWSIHNVLLDVTGGSLSLLQLILDCQNTNDWSGIEGDPLKFGLSLVSMVFDLFFMFQHFVLYPDADDAEARSSDEEEDLEEGWWRRRRSSNAMKQISGDWSPTYGSALLEGHEASLSDSPPGGGGGGGRAEEMKKQRKKHKKGPRAIEERV